MGQVKIVEKYHELIHIQDKDNEIRITAMSYDGRKSIDFVFGHGTYKSMIVVDELPWQKDTYVEVKNAIYPMLGLDAFEGDINEKRRLLLAWDNIKSLIQDDIECTLQRLVKEKVRKIDKLNRENEIILNIKI